MGHVSLTIHLWGDLSAVMHKDLYSMSKVADFKVIGKRSTEKNGHRKKVHPKMKKAEKTSTPGRKVN